jgi:lipopolysaccharide transport system ATP-binding protein
MSSENAIEVKNLGKCYQIYDKPHHRLRQLFALKGKCFYRKFWALRDVSFEIKKGETVGIIGVNGSGKSTLLQLICGTLNASDGQVKTQGRIAALLELGSGFNPEFTGRENIYLYSSILGLTVDEINEKFEEIISFADIGEFIDQPIKIYSSGMVVRLAFSVSVCIKPDILIVDEALAVGDEAFQRKCFAKIEEIKSGGATILFCSHSAQTIIQLCDRAILLDRGSLLLQSDSVIVTKIYWHLISSSANAIEKIRGEVIQKGALFLNSLPDENSATPAVPNEELGTDSHYDSSLIKAPTSIFEERGGRIANLRILSAQNKEVNILYIGQKYSIEIDAIFTLDVFSPDFEFIFKTVNGIVVAGANSSKALSNEKNIRIEHSRHVKIRFDFSCNLVPAVYFLSATIRGTLCEERIIVHKIMEGWAVRVVSSSENIDLGFAGLNSSVSMIPN